MVDYLECHIPGKFAGSESQNQCMPLTAEQDSIVMFDLLRL